MGTSQAKYFTTEMLIDYLSSGDCQKDNLARGYIIGVYDTFDGTLYEPHQSLTEDEIVEIIGQYVKDKQNNLDYQAQTVILRALDHYFQDSKEQSR